MRTRYRLALRYLLAAGAETALSAEADRVPATVVAGEVLDAVLERLDNRSA